MASIKKAKKFGLILQLVESVARWESPNFVEEGGDFPIARVTSFCEGKINYLIDILKYVNKNYMFLQEPQFIVGQIDGKDCIKCRTLLFPIT